MSFLKSPAPEPTNLCMWFYDNPAMDTIINVDDDGNIAPNTGTDVIFDSANEYDSKYIEGLLVNNVHNDENSSVEYYNGFHLYENQHGTQWKIPIDDTGFGVDYNNAPIIVKVADWAMGNPHLSNWIRKFDKTSRLYAKYMWYYKVNNKIHVSDIYS